MEKNIKIIKITNTDLNSKPPYKRPYKKQYNKQPTPSPQQNQLYTDILSSSKKVMDIIKKTKRNRNMFKSEKEPNVQNPVSKEIEVKKDIDKPKKVSFEKKDPEEFIPKKTKRNLEKYFKYVKPKEIQKKTIKKKQVNNNTNNSKKLCVKSKSTDVLKFFNKKNASKIKIFTKKEIKRFIHVMLNYSLYENYRFIHKYIKKLNKYQTNQILFALRLINKKSKAPVKLLKNILYGYFCSNDLIIIKQ
tara:strand:- start:1127 stop:1864 length:738 start_codon:yes stop_codon:yes gene_type:complete